MDAATSHLLYEDDAGEVIGVDEMQLLEEPLTDRVPALRALLDSPDGYIAFQAAQILTAWADPAGIAFFERLVRHWPEGGPGYYTHRIYDYDTSADLIAEAVDVYALAGGDRARATTMLRALLRLYGPVRFEGRLQDVLVRRGDPALADAAEAAVDRAAAHARYHLATQLLPALARWRGDGVLPLLDRLSTEEDQPNPRLNVVEALRYVSPAAARARLARLVADPDDAVAAAARAALAP